MDVELDCNGCRTDFAVVVYNTGIFDIRQPKLLHTIQAHEMHVRSLYIDEAGMTLCSGSGEGDMKVPTVDPRPELFSNVPHDMVLTFKLFVSIDLELGDVRAIVSVRQLTGEE